MSHMFYGDDPIRDFPGTPAEHMADILRTVADAWGEEAAWSADTLCVVMGLRALRAQTLTPDENEVCSAALGRLIEGHGPKMVVASTLLARRLRWEAELMRLAEPQ